MVTKTTLIASLLVFLTSFFTTVLSASSLSQENEAHPTNDSHYGHDIDLRSIMITNNIFCRNLFQKLPQSGNIVFSPLTITTALEMVYLGARKGTAREMSRVLKHNLAGLTTTRKVHKDFQKLQDYLERDSKYSLDYVNSVLVDKSYNITSLYRRNLKKFYHAEVKQVDFRSNEGRDAMNRINKYVSKVTRGKIAEFLKEPLDPATVLFLMSAVYFKGVWKTSFPDGLTVKRTFYNNGVDPVQVPMMKLIREPLMFGRDPENGISAVELPYRGGDFSMLIVLPDDRNGLPVLEGRASGIKGAIGPDRPITEFMNETEVDLMIPKFRIEAEFDLIDTLKSMGMKKVFSRNAANLSGISKANDLYVGRALHKAVIEVNEDGTEAAAVSGMAVLGRSSIEPGVSFRADHPFLYFIRDVHSGIVIFAGRVTEL